MFCVVVEDYIVVANATSYSVTMVTASSSGSVDIPFTVTFQLQHYNETFFRPTGHILLTVNISTNSEDNDTAVFHFDDDTVARVHTSAANNGFTFLDHINAGDTLVLQDIIIFSFDLSTRVTEPRTFNFFTELYSGDCIDCVGSGVITVDRTPLFQGAVTLIPPGACTYDTACMHACIIVVLRPHQRKSHHKKRFQCVHAKQTTCDQYQFEQAAAAAVLAAFSISSC